jgi:hypothetical protein
MHAFKIYDRSGGSAEIAHIIIIRYGVQANGIKSINYGIAHFQPIKTEVGRFST